MGRKALSEDTFNLRVRIPQELADKLFTKGSNLSAVVREALEQYVSKPKKRKKKKKKASAGGNTMADIAGRLEQERSLHPSEERKCVEDDDWDIGTRPPTKPAPVPRRKMTEENAWCGWCNGSLDENGYCYTCGKIVWELRADGYLYPV